MKNEEIIDLEEVLGSRGYSYNDVESFIKDESDIIILPRKKDKFLAVDLETTTIIKLMHSQRPEIRVEIAKKKDEEIQTLEQQVSTKIFSMH